MIVKEYTVDEMKLFLKDCGFIERNSMLGSVSRKSCHYWINEDVDGSPLYFEEMPSIMIELWGYRWFMIPSTLHDFILTFSQSLAYYHRKLGVQQGHEEYQDRLKNLIFGRHLDKLNTLLEKE